MSNIKIFDQLRTCMCNVTIIYDRFKLLINSKRSPIVSFNFSGCRFLELDQARYYNDELFRKKGMPYYNGAYFVLPT